MADKNLWSNYTEKDTLTDKDEVMVYDSVGKTNKRSLIEKFWDYVVEKMATAVISKLETENKTVIGALNYLNGKSESCICSPGKNFEKALQNNKIVLVFISPLVNSNIRSTGAAIVATRGSDDYSGKCTEISPINSDVTLSLDGSNLKVNSAIWIRINITVL